MEDLHFYKLEDLVKIPCVGFDLVPYSWFWLERELDAKMFCELLDKDVFRKFLPGLDLSSEEALNKNFMGLIMRTECGMGFSYMLRINAVPLGMINIETPAYNSLTINCDIWTIDFFMLPIMEHKGLMFNALISMLEFLKETIDVPQIYALVDVENESCLRLVGNGLLNEISNVGFSNTTGGRPPRVFTLKWR